MKKIIQNIYKNEKLKYIKQFILKKLNLKKS